MNSFGHPIDDNLYDVLFWINGHAVTERALTIRNYYGFNSSLSLSSCIMSGTSEFIRGGINSTVSASRCHMTESVKNAISLVNPKSLILDTCVISKCGGEGVQIKWLSDSDSKDHFR